MKSARDVIQHGFSYSSQTLVPKINPAVAPAWGRLLLPAALAPKAPAVQPAPTRKRPSDKSTDHPSRKRRADRAAPAPARRLRRWRRTSRQLGQPELV